MNDEELARTLLDKEPEHWPSPYRAARPLEVPAPAHTMPAELRARIQARIDAAGGELVRRRRPPMYWAAAAILPLAVAAGWFVWVESGRPDYALKVARVDGRVLGFAPNGSMQALSAKAGVMEGDALEIPGKGRLLLNAGRRTMFEISGPARVNLRRARGPAPDIRMNVEYGSVAIFSGGDEKAKKVVWSSGAYTYTMTGTVARLTVRGDSRRLSVARGSFQVHAPARKKPVRVTEGRVLRVEGEKISSRPLPEADRAALLESEKKLLPAPVPEKKAVPLNPDLELKTEKAIRAHYGALYRIILTNGTEYRGFPAREGDSWRIHTIYGIVHADNKFIRSVEALP